MRQQYYNFLERLLRQNLACSPQKQNCTDLAKCAAYLEKRALKSCMIVSLYRKSMLKIISEVKRDSKQNKLNDVFIDVDRLLPKTTEATVQTDAYETIPARIENAVIQSNFMLKRKKTTNVSVQTDPLPRRKHPDVVITTAEQESEAANSLEVKIKNFERKLEEENRKRKQFSHYLSQKQKETERRSVLLTKKMKYAILEPIVNTPSPCPSSELCTPKTPTALMETPMALLETPTFDKSAHQTEDSIAKELQTLFGTDDDQNTDIFGQPTNTSQNNQICTTINNFVVPVASTVSTLSTTSNCSTEPSPIVNYPNTILHEPEAIAPAVDFALELKTSLWPCELHMQRMNLHQVLTDVASKGFRRSERVRRKFEQLFGPEDGDDDFGPYSPSMELDDMILTSCKNRIAPWIVKSLMRPMKEGLIANRFLFKKLAKTIAERLILLNQYPGNWYKCCFNRNFLLNLILYCLDEKDVEDAVNEYFCEHPRVNSIEDVY